MSSFRVVEMQIYVKTGHNVFDYKSPLAYIKKCNTENNKDTGKFVISYFFLLYWFVAS